MRFVGAFLVAMIGGLLVACSAEDSQPTDSTGGLSAVGGQWGVGGGTETGGQTGTGGQWASGGAATGGAATGGAATGGAATGGAATGGAATGGAATGGVATGGVATGGVATGATGGVATGGTAMGGTATGGAAGDGGTATGGVGSVGTVDVFAMAADMGIGTNIGNTLENTTIWETGWGQPLISREYISGIANRGIRSVRVPVAWDTYAVNGVIQPDKMDRVREVVGWIEEAGMYPVVNIHWDGGWIFNEGTGNEFRLTDDVKTKFVSYWTQIATSFRDVGHRLILEGLNEEARFWVDGAENGTPDYGALNELNQLFVDTVRDQGGYNESRALLIAGFRTDIDLTCVGQFTVPNDPAGPGKLFLSLHYYTPFTFCGLDTVESWGTPETTWGDAAQRAELEAKFNTAGDFSRQRNIPIILGEFAVTPGENYPREPASRTLWMQSVAEAALARGMVPMLWDTGSEISRVDGSFSPEFQAVMDGLGY